MTSTDSLILRLTSDVHRRLRGDRSEIAAKDYAPFAFDVVVGCEWVSGHSVESSTGCVSFLAGSWWSTSMPNVRWYLVAYGHQ
jgi:hypothetical protein